MPETKVTSVESAMSIAALEAVSANCRGTFGVGGALVDDNGNVPHALGQLAPDQFRQLHQPKAGEPTKLRMVYSAG